ncbi:right-handed parallel beta-helix repeat-containing protein [Jeotgalibacillus haloalkalitolerans]|uniref:Glycosyl hydrolase family 28-related protein n=1 Tax=Jeotgalibacillus haloalkalitolerans TaxID=3104292 RepID=A0ABU5KK73_9BACL|nr:right-handed parallel beta-helix repeat-containing protein [Jeotgalibacillus sp. HH7-29]MDZ5711669.1 glycosyl hydrolase family 28-related protein [Jeotgalibacillus sp. HH7-29]
MRKPVNYVEILSEGNVIKHGDTYTPFRVRLLNASGEPVDLTGATVEWALANSNGLLFTKAAEIESEPGVIKFQLDADDQVTSGNMRVEIIVTRESSVQKFPAESWLALLIEPTLENINGTPIAMANVQFFNTQVGELKGFVDEVADVSYAASLEANQAMTLAQILQNQVDQVTGASTIDPAVEQMKVDTEGTVFPSPDARLRSDFQKVNVQLEQKTQLKNSEWVNVKYPPPPMAGAKGDGVTDDTAAIQACLNLTGGVFIPKGTYIVDSLIVDSSTKIMGAGKGISNLKFISSPTGALFDCKGNSTSLKENIEICGLSFINRIDHNRVGYAGVFIAIDYTKRVQIHNNEFKDFNTHAIYARDIDGNATEPHSFMIYNNVFRSDRWEAIGIFLDAEAEYGMVHSNSFHSLKCGIRLYQAANNQIRGNTFLKCGGGAYGVIDITCPAQNSGKTLIEGNTLNHTYNDGIKITSTFGTGQHGNNITGNEILAVYPGKVPIRVLGSKGNLISNNRLWAGASADPAVILQDNGTSVADYNLIVNNIALSSTIAVSNTSTGTQNSITGNLAGVPI